MDDNEELNECVRDVVDTIRASESDPARIAGALLGVAAAVVVGMGERRRDLFVEAAGHVFDSALRVQLGLERPDKSVS